MRSGKIIMLKRNEFSRTSRWLVANLLDMSGVLIRKKSLKADALSPARILVLRTDGIGDVIVTLPLFASLKRTWPSARLDCLMRPAGAAVAQGAIDRAIISCSPAEDIRTAFRLRPEKYDIIISPRPDGYIAHHVLSYIMKGNRRFGFAMKGGGFLITDSVSWNGARPIVELNGMIARAVGASSYDRVPKLAVSDIGRRSAQELLRSLRLEPGACLVGISPYASHSCLWPDERWSSLCAKLAAIPNMRLLMMGEGKRRADIEKIIRASGAAIPDLSGQTDLPRLIALISMLSLVVTVDSGPRHIAAATGTPAVVLRNGANSSVLWGKYVDTETVMMHPVPCAPCGKSWCPESERSCMTGITVDTVFDAVVAALKLKGKI